MRDVSETSLSGCYQHPEHGTYFATAGQRVDPSVQSSFVWRETSTYELREKLSVMSYTNWFPGEPTGTAYGSIEACINLWSGQSYKWNDYICAYERCFICEVDIINQLHAL